MRRTPLLFITAISLAGCAKDSAVDYVPEDCDSIRPTYFPDIAGILEANCTFSGCHDAATASKGVRLDTWEDAVIAVNSTAVDILCSINRKGVCGYMPLGLPKLDDRTIRMIECWIENGTPQ